MQKKDLKPGYTVQLRNQKYYTVIQEDDKLYISDLGDTKISIDMYDDDLLIDDDPYNGDLDLCDYDIIDVYTKEEKSIWNKEITVQLNGNLIARQFRTIHQYIEKPQEVFWKGTVKELVDLKGYIPNSDYRVYWENKPTKIKRNGKVRLHFNNAVWAYDCDLGTKCKETENIIVKIKYAPANISSFQELMKILPPDDFIEWLKDSEIVIMV